MLPERFAPIAYALFRIAFGFVFLSFGLQKTMGMFGGTVPPLMSMQGAAGVIETACGLLIMIGLFTKPAAFLASGEMAVAYFMIHVGVIGGWQNWLPLQNRGADSMMFCFAFFYIAFRGAGPLSVDGLLRGSKR